MILTTVNNNDNGTVKLH